MVVMTVILHRCLTDGSNVVFMARSVVVFFFFFSSRRRHTRCSRDWSSDVCSSDLSDGPHLASMCGAAGPGATPWTIRQILVRRARAAGGCSVVRGGKSCGCRRPGDRKSVV